MEPDSDAAKDAKDASALQRGTQRCVVYGSKWGPIPLIPLPKPVCSLSLDPLADSRILWQQLFAGMTGLSGFSGSAQEARSQDHSCVGKVTLMASDDLMADSCWQHTGSATLHIPKISPRHDHEAVLHRGSAERERERERDREKE